ncbi:DUF6542 domain-containing protein [Pseudonocardia sp. CA-107938]|uniref:DUF6542 domain-containing protein n=1 Tax=Pseudonocardia sp. CA-107938 TaxID=3240021 RepID=UPI003D8F20A2
MAPSSSDPWTVGERSIVPSVLGLSSLVAVAIAAALTLLGVLVDLMRQGTLGFVFTVLYIAGCVLAIAWVRRDGLFGPLVAPPLLLAVAVPAVVLIAGDPKPGTGMAERALQIGAPLVNSFPIMAGTTAFVLVVGVFRMATQKLRRTPSLDKKPAREPAKREPAAARGAARRSTSPRRS